jgi:outer membrane biosynthesis protein TonB
VTGEASRGMRTGLTISGAGHAAVLLWSVLTLAMRPYHTEPMTAVPIDVISTSDFSQMTNGAENAKPAERPKPLAEKIGVAAPVDDPAAKVTKKEVKAATDVPPVSEPKPPAPKAQKQPPAPADPIADALKKDEDKKPEPKKAELKPPPTPPKKPVQPETAPTFDARKVAALLDKRTPERLASAGDIVSNTVPQGTSTGAASQLSQMELDALRIRLGQLWNPPSGAKDPQELTVTIRFKLKPDGTLDGPPIPVTRGNSPLFMAARDSAVRAVLRGQPFVMLRPEHYDLWQEIEVTFDDSMMSRG